MTLIEESRTHPNEVLVKLSTLVNELTEERDRLRKALETFADKDSWHMGRHFHGVFVHHKWLGGDNPRELAANALEGKK